MKSRVLVLVLGCWLTVSAIPVWSQEPLAEKVKKGIDKGIAYMRQQQKLDGSWELATNAPVMGGGWSCLAFLALLEAGVPLEDKMMRDGLAFVRKVDSNMTYVRALQTMALAKAGYEQDKIKIKQNVDWLISAGVIKNGELKGWGYGQGQVQRPDGSNTQFALLGLWAGKDAGVQIPQEFWKKVRNHYLTDQEVDGGWAYVKGEKTPHGSGSNMTMTVAGVCGLIIAGMEIQEGREQLQENGPALNCGNYKENIPLARGMKWLENNFQMQLDGRTFYNLYGIERLGRLTGHRFIGNHDWYREGCEFLVEKQNRDGSWVLQGFSDKWENVSTSMALLFLSKGRTPVLISKLVHGAWPRNPADNDWNRDKNAVKNLTDYVSKELFTQRDKQGNVRPLPLAWQIFDLMQAAAAKGATTEKGVQAITAEMLQSPIIFLNGHNTPRLTEREKDLLKRYVENGGFIIAEACCGSKGFDQGFRELVADLWPNNELTKLSPDHPIWRYPAEVPPGAFNLHGLEMGCKTVLVYAPEDLSCLWEANKLESAQAQLAFRTGANIVAYATGMVPPLPRLTDIAIASREDEKGLSPPRFYLKVAQLHYRKDWVPPAPAAMFNLMSHLRNFAGMDVVLNPEKMTIDHEDLTNFKFIYFHDRGKFDFDSDRLKTLRFNLKTGGLLFADACCGSKLFDQSFRKFSKQLFPEHDLQPVPADDVLFSKDLNGEALTRNTIQARQTPGKPMEPMAPFLEGIQIDGRWVVLYSKYDIGCALERHQANDCIGYDYESAQRLAGAAVLYLMSP